MKSLCKIKRSEYDDLLPKIRKLVGNPQYICKKCLRAASEKKLLCKPDKLG